MSGYLLSAMSKALRGKYPVFIFPSRQELGSRYLCKFLQAYDFTLICRNHGTASPQEREVSLASMMPSNLRSDFNSFALNC